jgi:Xaa-Pro aminopeptidase
VDHQLRRTRLSERLPDLEVDAVLITDPSNVRYLTGFTGSNGQVLVTAGEATFFTDGRYTEQARHEAPDLETVTYRSSIEPALGERCAAIGATRVGFEAHAVTVRLHQRAVEALPALELIPVGDAVGRLRWIKDREEVELLRQAQATTDEAFEEILEFLAVGQSERQVALELERLLRRDGADALSFDSIVAFGDHAAQPHHEPCHRLLEEGDVIKMDFGALREGYHADFTRTVAFGEPAAELKKVHDVVREAQQMGIDAIAPGVSGAAVDRAARSVIEEAGYGEAFAHGLGHGVGLDIHEGPRLGREFEDHELPTGAVVTVEPGIYLPRLGGVRIEDMIEVTEDGGRAMSSATRELIEL